MAQERLLYVITKGSWGGAGRYVYDLASALKDEYAVSVAVGTGGSLSTKLEAVGIRTVPIASLGRDIHATRDSAAFFELYRLFRREKPDIVHLNSSKAGALGALAARLAGVPRIVYTVHGWAFNEPVSQLAKAFRWLASLITMLLCHRIITVSHFDMLHNPMGLHSVTIHNGIAPIDYVPRDEARAYLCKKAGISTEGFIVGTIAELHTNKGIDLLIQAAYLVDNVQVIVMGEGEERTALEQLIRELGLESRVHLIGFVDGAARYLQAFDTFMLPSRKEGLPYAVLEAGMAQVPVIASAIGGIPEIVQDQITGDLVHPFQDLKLAESLKEFSESPNTIRQYAEALHAHVSRYFSLHGMIKRTREVYER